jgi:hypothetical protein
MNVTWRILHNEELHNLYSSRKIIRVIRSRKMRYMGHLIYMEDTTSTNKILVGKPEGKRLFVRPKRRWQDNIRTDLKVIGLEGVDWMHLVQDMEQ